MMMWFSDLIVAIIIIIIATIMTIIFGHMWCNKVGSASLRSWHCCWQRVHPEQAVRQAGTENMARIDGCQKDFRLKIETFLVCLMSVVEVGVDV